MTPLMLERSSIWWIAAAAAALYVVTAGLVLLNRRHHDRRFRLRRRFERMQVLADGGAGGARAPLRTALGKASLSTLQHLVTDRSVSRALQSTAALSLLDRLSEPRVLRDAKSQERHREGWRRIVALRTLAYARPLAATWGIWNRALGDGSLAVVGAVVTTLGQLPDRRAADLLARALVKGRGNRSRVATALDSFPIDIADQIIPMLGSPEPVVRYWGTKLIRRYATRPGMGTAIEKLAGDVDPLVRRAAVETIAAAGGPTAAIVARSLLGDPVAIVRAHAARTLGALGARETIEAVLPLLADEDWWVRYAAKQALEAMGPEIAGAIEPYLSHADTFARNGAAEVLQNLGSFEQLLVLEANNPPDPARLTTLRLLARAGGMPMWDSVFARLGGTAQTRARQILADIELDTLRHQREGAQAWTSTS